MEKLTFKKEKKYACTILGSREPSKGSFSRCYLRHPMDKTKLYERIRMVQSTFHGLLMELDKRLK